jgi:molybdopterin synthase catalytic subunit
MRRLPTHRVRLAAPRVASPAISYDGRVHVPHDRDTWVGLSADPLPVEEASRWAVQPRCGAVVLFSGTARDHAEGRPGVSLLEYEAYTEQVEPRLSAIVDRARRHWPDLGRMALLHRVGPVPVGESAVVVVASAPHRDAAFSAARFGIDTLKSTVPIWKREHWDGGQSWGLEAQHLVDVSAVPSGGEPSSAGTGGVQ